MQLHVITLIRYDIKLNLELSDFYLGKTGVESA